MTQRLEHLTRAVGLSQPTREADGTISLAWRIATAELLRDSFFTCCQALGSTQLIECGAHGAEASIRFVEMTGGDALAIEANPYTYDAKTLQAQASGVETQNVGLGQVAGHAQFHIPSPDWSQTQGSSSFLRRKGEDDYETVPVKVTTLDEIAAEIAGHEQIALWIDVEGFTEAVLLGGTELMSRDSCQVVLVELESREYWSDQSDNGVVDSLLFRFGFTPLMRDAEYEGQYNVIYVKERAAPAVDEIVIAFWSGLAALEVVAPRTVEWSTRRSLSRAKSSLTARSDSHFAAAVHRVAAALGSRSSKADRRE